MKEVQWVHSIHNNKNNIHNNNNNIHNILKKSSGYTAPAELREVDETIPELFHGFCFVTPNIDIIEYIAIQVVMMLYIIGCSHVCDISR